MSKKKEAVTEQDNRIVVFQEKSIRRTWHQNEWWFVVEDVVLVLVDSKDPKQYIQRMKQRDPELGKGWVQIVHTLWLEAEGELAQEATIRKFRMVREKEQQAGSVAVMEIMTGEASK